MRHMRTLGLLVLLMGFTLSVVGCAASEKTPENEPTPMPAPKVVVTRMAALCIGPLTMVDGCLRTGDSEASNLVVWPPDFEVSIEDDTIRVLYDDHEVEVRLGQVVRLGGGEVKSLEAFDERTRQQIPAGCPGPYWLVGSISPGEETEQPGAPANLDGTEWVLTSLNGDSLIEDTEIALYFEQAFLGGSMTCNGYGGGRDSGKYTATDEGTLTIPMIAVTLQLCSEPEGIMEQEAAYIEALRNAAAYRVVDDRLEIANAASETTLVFAWENEEFLPVPPTPTPMPHNPGVADLLRDPPAPGETVEVDAYFSGAGPVLSPEGPIPRPDEVACPTWWIMDAALTDRQFPAILVLPNTTTNNTLPDDAPWLVATEEEATKPGVRRAPQLPYHARLRGHLGDPAFAHCRHADRIFLIEEVVRVYEKEPSEPAAYQLEFPEGYANWPRHHDADLGYSLPYPPDWRVESLAEPDVLSAIALRAPQWPDNPVVVRVHDGETHRDPADPASRPPLLEGVSYGPMQQGLAFGKTIEDSQHLAGYQVDRQAGPGEQEVAVLFSAQGRTYELALRYPIGLDASQPLLTTYAAIVEGFRLDTP